MRLRQLSRRVVLASMLFAGLTAVMMGQQSQRPDPATALASTLAYIDKQILDMAEDFPAEKYSFRATPEVRSFAEVIVHAMSGTVYAAKSTRGENVKWTELDPKTYPTKAAIVTALKGAITDVDAAIKATPAARFSSSPEPLLAVIQHTSEHYGQLVVYYRLNGLVPPASRPKK